MFHFSEAENTQDRIPEVHQTILERLGDSLPFVPQIAGHLLEEKKQPQQPVAHHQPATTSNNQQQPATTSSSHN